MCSAATTKTCHVCETSSYCSKTCQEADWPCHKLACEAFKELDPTTRTLRCGIFFPVDQKRPEFVWVSCPLIEGPQVDPFFGDACHNRRYVFNNTLIPRKLDAFLTVIHLDPWTVGNPAVNQSVLSATKDQKPYHPWRGPILFLKNDCQRWDPDNPEYQDIGIGEFRDVVGFLTADGDPNLYFYDFIYPSSGVEKQISGVKISCQGDILAGAPKFEAIKVSERHRIVREGVSDLSKLINLPIQVLQCAPVKSLLRSGEYSRSNGTAAFINLRADPRSRSWGLAPEPWLGAGSVIVIRKDQKDLLPEHMEAMAHFFQYFLMPMFGDSRGAAG